MNVLWVSENINKESVFKLDKAQLLCIVSNLLFIKHFNPEFKTIFFVDKTNRDYYQHLGILDLFDQVDDTTLDTPIKINKKIFWSAGKILAQRHIKGPTLTVDLDFRIFSDIGKLGVFNSDVTCLWLENTENSEFYFDSKYASDLFRIDKIHYWSKYALNVSFLFLKNEWFKNLYCDYILDLMTKSYSLIEYSQDKTVNNKPILFLEQYMLHQLCMEHYQHINLLIDNFENIPHHQNYLHSIGVNMSNCPNYFYHYGDHKLIFKNKGVEFDNEIRCNYDVTNSIIRNKKGLEVFNYIYSLDKNDYFFS
jgi:hypothetical protein